MKTINLTDVSYEQFEEIYFVTMALKFFPDIHELKEKIDWYYEQICQMEEMGGDDFMKHMANEANRQKDEMEQLMSHQ